jgi:hypothetical protein
MQIANEFQFSTAPFPKTGQALSPFLALENKGLNPTRSVGDNTCHQEKKDYFNQRFFGCQQKRINNFVDNLCRMM